MVAEVGEDLRARLHEILVVAVALLGVVAVGAVVLRLRFLAPAEEVGLLAPEEIELPPDHVGEALPAEHDLH